jgi:hypothetical protein
MDRKKKARASLSSSRRLTLTIVAQKNRYTYATRAGQECGINELIQSEIDGASSFLCEETDASC